MDTSEIYIKMCEKAEEIQKTHILIYSDLCVAWYTGEFYEPKGYRIGYYLQDNLVKRIDSNETFVKQTLIWLPRQDQLQEMVKREYKESPQAGLWYVFQKFVTYRIVNIEEDDLPSWEQLWLAFCMVEKFKKVWNGEEWVASESSKPI